MRINQNFSRYYLFLIVLITVFSCNRSNIVNTKEKEWLKKHPDLVVGISPNAPPYEFVDENGEINGIFIDFLSIIEDRIDYKFKRVYQSDFSKMLEDTRNGDIDVLIEIQKTEEREKYLSFTPFLLSHSHIIVVKKSHQKINSIEDLTNKSIAVVNKYAVQEYLSHNYPHLQLVPFIDDISCLRAVSLGQADAFICQQAVATFYIDSEGISNLSISGEINYENELAIACRKELDTLHIILTNAVNSISKNEKQKIYSKWLSYAIVPFYYTSKFWIIFTIIFLSILAFVIMFIAILQKRVKIKTKELEIAKNRAEESDRLKSAFLANMSHEIRTPMNGILGFAELLKEPGLTGDDQHLYIKIIEKSGIRMLNIINDIVDIARIESGQVEVGLMQTNVNELIEFVYTFFKPEVERKGMNLYLNSILPPENSVFITDKEKLYAILINLVKNAIKYSNYGTIEMGCQILNFEIPLSETMSGQVEIAFYVKDNGIGIPKDRQKAIFERFVQADISDKHALQGAGLGLAIAKAYVEMLGGKIWVESEENQGSIFRFTILCSIINEQPEIVTFQEESDLESIKINQLKILIVEDEETSDYLLSLAINKHSREILHAKTGTEAVEVCRQHPDIDLVMMDIKLPAMDGYEATQQIRKFNNKVVIIAQTAYAMLGDKEKAIEAGCNDYIAKPLSKSLLLGLVQKYFSN